MIASLSRNEENKYDRILVQPDSLFDEDWIRSRIGNVGTTHTVELAVVDVFGRTSIEIKLPNLDEKNPPSMKTKIQGTA